MHPRQIDEADLRALAILGQAVRIARVRSALSQRRLATRSGVSQSAISRVERGASRGLNLRYFARVVLALGSSMPLVGCPHGHDCEFARQWRNTLRALSVDPDEQPHHADEGTTLFELMRRAEQAGYVDELGNAIDDRGNAIDELGNGIGDFGNPDDDQ